jgi:type I restriction enzyme, R subunit
VTDRASPSDWLEDIASLLPAVTLLQQIGYTYLAPEEALQKRGGKRSRVVLEEVLAEQLQRLNQIEYRGRKHDFSATNIQKAVEAISQFPYDALSTTSQALYDLITLGKSLEQTIEGDKKSYTLKYIDWQNPANNVFHVADEFVIERLGSTQTRRPDLVLFVNGIPLVAVECKRPDLRDAVDEAISQHLRNQYREEIPHFFCLTQLLLAVSQNAAKYGTTSTSKEFWAVWKEEATEGLEQELYALVNTPITGKHKQKMFAGCKPWQREKPEEIWVPGERQVSAQDRALYSLLRPIFGYIVFDAGDKKVARYQQYFAVKATFLYWQMSRIAVSMARPRPKCVMSSRKVVIRYTLEYRARKTLAIEVHPDSSVHMSMSKLPMT